MKFDVVAAILRDAECPCRELGPGPLEAMVRVSEAAGRHAFEQGVVFAVWRRNDHAARLGVAKQRQFQRRQPWWIDMLNDLDKCGRVKRAPCPVAIGQAAKAQRDALAQCLAGTVEMQASCGSLNARNRNIDPDNLRNTLLFQ